MSDVWQAVLLGIVGPLVGVIIGWVSMYLLLRAHGWRPGAEDRRQP